MAAPLSELLPLQQWQLGLLAVLPVMVLSLVFLTTKQSRRGNSTGTKGGARLPPGPTQVPVLGNLHQLGPLPHRNLRELARRHGPVMLLRLGTVPTVVVSSAEAAREVMKAHDVDCCSRPVSPGPKRLSYDLKNVAFAPYDEYWREMRKLFIVELLSMRRVKAAWYAREQQVDKLLCNLRRMGPNPVALNEHIFGLADGIIGTVAFGNIYGTERFAHKQHFQHVLDEAMDMMASFSAEDFFPNAAGRLVDRLTGLVARRERIFTELDAFFDMVIDQHMDPARDDNGGGDLVDVLIDLWKQHRGTLRFTRDHVKGIILDTFLGGIDTSSVTMLWAMSELIRKPRVLKKVQDEIRAVVGNNNKDRVEPDDVPKLAYLKMVVKETLRLHPPATLLLPRETMRRVTIGGYDVPEKTRVFVNAWAIGRDPASWTDDAEEFRPERFEVSDVDFNGAHFELVPFGAGRRICPGLAMGVTNVEFTLANLLYCFDWTLPEGMKPEDVSMDEAGGLTFHRKTPLVLVPTTYQPVA
ncbi:hypothetical protein PR202_ga14162 [Eleusine coracana subsp. coracana]|uniref:4-hydroxyphenylacetaldehyde oxime monooxygenase n=1 Tax=Eleusine coracana subsp. coracana TaxID=191504 RepID=A0AAV5CGM6_ELECO|nr:hypothetical protein QOZ80_3AG0208340 [Eleusine coracana subsp. coracana]GJM97249.1 hypothetical protein PR202_ga14162 [Eleusine coracana subsp. coracana]